MLGLGLSLPEVAVRSSGPTVISPSAQFFARVTDPGATRRALYQALVDSLVASGVWTLLDALWLFAAVDAATALTNLVSANFGATTTGAPTFTADHGYTGSALVKYIDTGFNPSTAGGKFQQNSASGFIWPTKVGTDPGGMMGKVAPVRAPIEILARYTDNHTYGLINGNTELSFASGLSDGSGLVCATRVNSTQASMYRNGALLSTVASASVALANQSIIFLGDSGNYFSGTVLCGGVGAGLSAQNNTDLYNALHTYLQAVAGIA